MPVFIPDWHLVNRSLVNAAHARGIAVIPWTVNNPAVMRKMIAAGIAGMISDDVDQMLQVVAEGVPAAR